MVTKNKEIFCELDPPSIVCGKCRFTSSVEGEWSAHYGRLTFIAAADPQPRRGPDLFTCGECGSEFHHVSTDWNSKRLDENVLAAVQATASKAREAEWEAFDCLDEA